MCSAKPAHFVLDNPVEKHSVRSERVARAFCEAYSAGQGRKAIFINSECHGVDALIDVDGENILLEFVGYIQRDESHDVETGDIELQRALSDALSQTALPRYEIHLNWREEPRRKRKRFAGDRRTRIPTGKQSQQFISEILRLADDVSNAVVLQDRRICFVSHPSISTYKTEQAHVAMNPDCFPTVAYFCRSLRFMPWCHDFLPEIRTSVRARHMALDRQQIIRCVEVKFEKLGDHYQKSAQAFPIWLVLHSDGWPLSRRVFPTDLEEAIELVKRTAAAKTPQFEAIWWLDATVNLHSVIPAKQR